MLARAARTKFAEPIGRRHSAIHEDIAAGDKRAVSTHEECADRSHLVGSASASGLRTLRSCAGSLRHAARSIHPWRAG